MYLKLLLYKPLVIISHPYNLLMLTRRSLSTHTSKHKLPLLSDKKKESIKIEYEEEKKETSNVKLNRSMTVVKKS